MSRFIEVASAPITRMIAPAERARDLMHRLDKMGYTLAETQNKIENADVLIATFHGGEFGMTVAHRSQSDAVADGLSRYSGKTSVIVDPSNIIREPKPLQDVMEGVAVTRLLASNSLLQEAYYHAGSFLRKQAKIHEALLPTVRNLVNGIDRTKVIIATHYILQNILTELKSKGILKNILFSVTTDSFYLHSEYAWNSDLVDGFCVFNQQTAKVARLMGIPAEKIYVTGPPTHAQLKLSRQARLESLNNPNGTATGIAFTGGANTNAGEIGALFKNGNFLNHLRTGRLRLAVFAPIYPKTAAEWVKNLSLVNVNANHVHEPDTRSNKDIDTAFAGFDNVPVTIFSCPTISDASSFGVKLIGDPRFHFVLSKPSGDRLWEAAHAGLPVYRLKPWGPHEYLSGNYAIRVGFMSNPNGQPGSQILHDYQSGNLAMMAANADNTAFALDGAKNISEVVFGNADRLRYSTILSNSVDS